MPKKKKNDNPSISRVIYFDFKKKKHVETHTEYIWKCASCNTLEKYDSRSTENMLHVELYSGRKLCKNCIVELGGLAKENGWLDTEFQN